jgi:hypothetical protein
MGYLPDHPALPRDRAPARSSSPTPSAQADATMVDPPTMGYLPSRPPPPREVALEEAPPPLAAPRTPVQSRRLPPG